MQSLTQLSRRSLVALAGATALVSVQAYAAQVITTANADVETREATPEFTRGLLSSTTSSELTINNNPTGGSNRNVDVVRFSVPNTITSSAQLEGYAELRIFFRSNNITAGQPGVARIYGLNPANTLNSTWSETSTFYRDAGIHQDIDSTGLALKTPSVIAQPANPASAAIGVPAAPISASAGYGASTTNSQRAPGIRYENAPYSAQTEAENQARYTYNLNVRANYEANGTNGTYLPYLNQPGYNVTKTATNNQSNLLTQSGTVDMWNDIPESNRPLFSGATDTWVDDVTDATLLGYSRIKVTAATPGEGQYMSLGGMNPAALLTGLTPTELAQNQADSATAMANLVAFIGQGIDNGYHDFTFLIGDGINNLDGLLPNEQQGNQNLNFASKEYTPVNIAWGGQGAFAPQLILAPEPGSLTLAGLATVGLFGRRRRD